MSDKGMSLTNWKLCARLLAPLDAYILVTFSDDPPDRWLIYFADPNPFPYEWFIVSSGQGPGHFPFGIPVEPD